MPSSTYTFSLFNNEPSIRAAAEGEVIFAQGDPGDVMYALLDGSVDILKNGKLLETIAPGGVFGEMALLEQQPRNASAIATAASRLAMITAPRFTTVVSQNPPFALAMMRVLSERLRRDGAS